MRACPPLYSSLPLTIRAILARHHANSAALSASSNSSSTSSLATYDKAQTHNFQHTAHSKDADTGEIVVKGWIKSVRAHKNVSFAAISDGSSSDVLQAVFKGQDLTGQMNMGMAVELRGNIQRSKGKGQDIELVVDKSTILGPCDLQTYPIQRKYVPPHVLRDQAHLRFKTTCMGSIMRARDALMRDWHDWFEENEFIHVHTPILTSSDCEGAGEVFRLQDRAPAPERKSALDLDSAEPPLTPSTTSSQENPAATSLESSPPPHSEPPEAFFPHPVNLTVSSQLHLEAPTHALSRTYTLSPSFRSEKSMTSRHLAEFYMLEGEVIVNSLDALLDIVEDGIRSSLNRIVNGGSLRHQNIRKDLEIIAISSFPEGEESASKSVPGVREDLIAAAQKPFSRITYTDAIALINKELDLSHDKQIEWGMGIPTEYEKFLAGHLGGPVFVTQYPASLKPFYMLPSSTDLSSTPNSPSDTSPHFQTVDCFDLLVPGIGELIGGSLREHRLSHLLEAINKAGLKEGDYGWYLDLRRFGSMPHGGWGMGWERYISWITRVGNVRDVVAFPRWMGHCKY